MKDPADEVSPIWGENLNCETQGTLTWAGNIDDEIIVTTKDNGNEHHVFKLQEPSENQKSRLENLIEESYETPINFSEKVSIVNENLIFLLVCATYISSDRG